VLFRIIGDESSSESASREAYIYAPKLEKGYIATDWDDGVDLLKASVNNSFSWKFSPSEGMFMWNGNQHEPTDKINETEEYGPTRGAVFAVYKDSDTEEHKLFVKGHIEATSGKIGEMTIEAVEKLPKDISDAVNNIEIGGRNLLKSSGDKITNSKYEIANYYLTETPVIGEEYTISLITKPAP
jgi:hypothetical protein